MQLGEFEELILTMVLYLNNEAYGNSIMTSLKELQDRSVSLSAIHVTLYRLEEKGLLKSYFGGATNERGGRRKRFFQVTNTGIALLKEMKATRVQLWNLIPQLN